MERERDLSRSQVKKVEELGEKIGILSSSSANNNNSLKSTSKNSKEKVFERMQKIDLETGLAPLTRERPYFPPPNPEMIDLVLLAQTQSQRQLILFTQERARASSLQEEITTLLDQLAKRDREITRLGSQLELVRQHQFTTGVKGKGMSGGGLVGLGGVQDLEGAKERISNLEMMVESLSSHIEALEGEVGEMEGQKITVQTSLAEEKRVVEMELERERKRTSLLTSNLDRMEKAVVELEALKSSSVSTMMKNGVIKPSNVVKNARLVQELEQKLALGGVKSEQAQKRLQMVQKDLLRVQGENGKLRGRIVELEAAETTLPPTTTNQTSTTTTTTTMMDREGKELVSKTMMDREVKELESKLIASHSSNSSLQRQLRSLVEEKSTLSLQLSSLTLKLEDLDGALERSKQETWIQSTEVKEGMRERATLLKALDEFGDLMTQVQERVGILTKDRDVVKSLYDQVHSELERVRREKGHRKTEDDDEVVMMMMEKTTITQDHSSIKDLEEENVKLRQQTLDLEGEIHSLKLDLKAMITRQRENGSLASEAVDLLEKELVELKEMHEHTQRQGERVQVELEQCERERKSIKDVNQGLSKQAELDSSRLGQLVLDMDKVKLGMRQANSAKAEVESRYHDLERDLVQLNLKMAEKERLIEEQKKLLVDIDGERDGFQRDLDLKTERLLEVQGRFLSCPHHVQIDWVWLSKSMKLVKGPIPVFRSRWIP